MRALRLFLVYICLAQLQLLVASAAKNATLKNAEPNTWVKLRKDSNTPHWNWSAAMHWDNER